MHINKSIRRLLIQCLIVLIVAGFLGFWASSFPVIQLSSFLHGFLALSWGVSINRRILNKKIRIFLILCAVLMAFWSVLRATKNCYLAGAGEDLRRLVWYLYYIPMLGIPMLMLFGALNINRSTGASPITYFAIGIVNAIFFAQIITNDAHRMMFSFHGPLSHWEGNYDFGFLYYPMILFLVAELVSSLVILIKQSTTPLMRRKSWIPTLPVLAVILYWLIHYFIPGMHPALFELPELFCFAAGGASELCLQLGLIPSNTGYDSLFHASTLPMRIEDRKGNVIYSSSRAADQNFSPSQYQKHTNAIFGGQAIWYDDVSEITERRRRLAEITEQLSEEMSLLKAENELKQAKVQYDTQNRLYDKISLSLKPQIEQVRELLSDTTLPEEEFKANLAKACFLTAYIKRMSNLTLIADVSPVIDFNEFILSLSESLANLRLCGVSCGVFQAVDSTHSQSKTLPSSETTLAAYSFTQYVLEQIFDSLKAVMINAESIEDSLQLRLTLTTDPHARSINLSDLPSRKGFETVIIQNREDETTFISLKIRKAGDIA